MTKQEHNWREEFDERWRIGENAPLTNHIEDIKTFIASVEQSAYDRCVSEIDSIQRYHFSPEGGTHEWIDTCDVYKKLQALKKSKDNQRIEK